MSKGNYEVFGKHVLLERIAMGGMAEIFLSRSAGAGGIGKFSAIKRILPQYSGNSEFINMFKDEAKINVNLSHSNIVPVYEFGVESGQFYIVMEYVNGKNLRQVINRMLKDSDVYFSIDQIVYIVREVAAGLDHAHRCLDGTTGKPLNIIHRDMSPQNIMVSYEGEIKVVDFGIAKAESQVESTKAGTLKGKFAYMSPEQAGGEEIDLKTDIYSLGIVLWELLAKDRLFMASNEINTLKKIREGKIPSIRSLNSDVNEALEKIVMKSLAKNKDERYQTCADFQRDLNRFLNTHYPDFSAHDFSIFIKSLYADEILQNRKKLIEYSNLKIDTSAMSSNNSDATVVASVTQPDIPSPRSNHLKLDFEMDQPQHATNIDFKSITINKTQKSDPRGGASAGTASGIRSQTQSSYSRYTGSYNYSGGMGSSANWSKYVLFVVVACGLALIASQIFPNLGSSGVQEISSKDIAMNEQNSNVLFKGVERKLIVRSNPPGAQIFVNGKNTGRVTPGRIDVPAEGEFNLELKKQGFIDYPRTMSAGSKETEVFATLQKNPIGYLDVSVVNPNNDPIKLYINNVSIPDQLPIRMYRVPSGKIVIRAVNQRLGLYAEETIDLKVDQRLQIRLNPRSQMR